MDSTQESVTSRRVVLAGAGALVAIGILIYLNSLKCPFVYDDHSFILQNESIRHLWPPWGALFAPQNLSRPLIGLADAINFAVSGVNPWSYHALNLAIHICAALALFGIVRRTLLTAGLRERFGEHSTALALVVAAIWLVHPLATAAVTYIVQRCESLMGMFYLVTLYCSIRSFHGDHKVRWRVCAIASCAAGMLSKEVMVTAPIIVLLYDYLFETKSFRASFATRRWLYIGLGATWGVLLATFVASPVNPTAGFAVKTISPLRYFVSEFAVIVHYLRLAVWPSPLCLDYLGWPAARTVGQIVPYGLFVGAIFAATVWALIKKKPSAFLGAWFFLILSVSSSIMPFADFVFEHRMYLPLAAVVAFVILGCYSLWTGILTRVPTDIAAAVRPNSVAGLALVTIVIAVLAFATVSRNIDYTSEVVMWSDVVRKRPDNQRGHTNLAICLASLNKTDEARLQFLEALRLDPNAQPANYNYGFLLYSQGNLEEAKPYLMKAAWLNPRDARAHFELGMLLTKQGNTESALKEFLSTVQIDRDFAEAHLQLGGGYEKEGKIDQAKEEYKQAARCRPDWQADISAHIASLK